MEIRARSQPYVGEVAKAGSPDIWNQMTWKPMELVVGANVILRIRGEDSWLHFDFDREASPSLALSYVDGEVMELVRPKMSPYPAGHIFPRRDNNRIHVDFLLVSLEHQFFQIQESWAALLDKYSFRKVRIESIDGHECWRLESTAAELEPYGKRLIIWLAPDLDFAPVRAVFNATLPGKYSFEGEMRVTDHMQVGTSWIAQKAVTSWTSKQIAHFEMSSFEVLDVVVGDQYAPISLRESFPEGTVVTDLVREERWIADGHGGRQDIEPLNMEEVRYSAQALQAEKNRPSMKSARGYGLLGIASGTVAVVGLMIFIKRRMA